MKNREKRRRMIPKSWSSCVPSRVPPFSRDGKRGSCTRYTFYTPFDRDAALLILCRKLFDMPLLECLVLRAQESRRVTATSLETHVCIGEHASSRRKVIKRGAKKVLQLKYIRLSETIPKALAESRMLSNSQIFLFWLYLFQQRRQQRGNFETVACRKHLITSISKCTTWQSIQESRSGTDRRFLSS